MTAQIRTSTLRKFAMIAKPLSIEDEITLADRLPPEVMERITFIFEELESLEARAEELHSQADRIIDSYASKIKMSSKGRCAK